MPRPTDAHNQDADQQGPVGRFRFSPLTDVWEWDETAAALHGLGSGTRSMSTEQLLPLVHPDDRQRLTVARHADGPLRLHYRAQATEAPARHLLLAGHRGASPEGPDVVEGHVVDLTDDLHVAGEAAARKAVEAAMEGRAAIEQAKGGLMLAYGLSEDQAFSVLRWWSRNHNIKVRLLAERLVATAHGGSYSHEELRAMFDRVLHDLATGPGTA